MTAFGVLAAAETVDVPISVDCEDATGLDLNIRLDPNYVEKAELVSPADSIKNSYYKANQSGNKFKVSIASTAPFDSDGTLFHLRLTLKKTAPEECELVKLLQIKVNERITYQASDCIILSGASQGSSYTTPLRITFNEGSATLNGKAYTSGDEIAYDGSYTLEVTDLNGKKRSLSFSIDTGLDLSINNNFATVRNIKDGYSYYYSETLSNWIPFDGRVQLTRANTFYYVRALSHDGEESIAKLPEATLGVAFKGASLVLDGSLCLKLYFDVDTTVTDLNRSFISYTAVPEGTGTTGSAHFKVGSDGRTAFVTMYTAAKDALHTYWCVDMEYHAKDGGYANMPAFIADGEMNISKYIKSLRTMANAGNEAALAALDVVDSMETYCKYADNFFDKSVTALPDVTCDMNAVSLIPDSAVTGESAGIAHYATSLILEERTTIRHYFNVTDGKTHTFKINGTTVTPTDTGEGIVYVDIEDVVAQNLDEAYTVIVDGKLTVTYRALNYVKLAIGYNDVKMKNLVKALYNYWYNAEEYAK